MLARCLAHLRQFAGRCLHLVGTHLSALTKPATPSLTLDAYSWSGGQRQAVNGLMAAKVG